MFQFRCPRCDSMSRWSREGFRRWLAFTWVGSCHACQVRVHALNPLLLGLVCASFTVFLILAPPYKGSLFPWLTPATAVLVCVMWPLLVIHSLRRPRLAPGETEVSPRARYWSRVAVWAAWLGGGGWLLADVALWAYLSHISRAAKQLPPGEAIALFDRTHQYVVLLIWLPLGIGAVAAAVSIVARVMRRRAGGG